MTTCPSCGGEVYRSLKESIGSTGSLRAAAVDRHEASGYIACPRRERKILRDGEVVE